MSINSEYFDLILLPAVMVVCNNIILSFYSLHDGDACKASQVRTESSE